MSLPQLCGSPCHLALVLCSPVEPLFLYQRSRSRTSPAPGAELPPVGEFENSQLLRLDRWEAFVVSTFQPFTDDTPCPRL